MKLSLFSLSLPLTLTLLASGCGKTEEAPLPPPPPVQSSPAADAAQAIDSATTAAQQTATDLRNQAAAAQTAAQDALAKAQDQAPALTSKAQATLDEAKKLLNDGNWAEALKLLNQLATVKLTPDQQATLAQLKQQAQNLAQQAVAGNAQEKAGKAIGDLLQKK